MFFKADQQLRLSRRVLLLEINPSIDLLVGSLVSWLLTGFIIRIRH